MSEEIQKASEPTAVNITGLEEPKVGVYLCHCGVNIAGVISMDELEAYTKTIPGVVKVTQYKFMCSDTGQNLIKDDIKKGEVNRVIVAACSPRMHEPTFRKCLRSVGMNQFLFEQANIREHNTWVHMRQPEKALEVAKDIVRIAVAKARNLEPLDVMTVKVKPVALVIGAGVAGINVAKDLANQNFQVHLVEKTPTIGGHMAQLDKTFPTMDCSACIITPEMSNIGQHPKINTINYAEVTDISGYVGNFHVTINKKPHYVDQSLCNSCGGCVDVCPVITENEFDEGMKDRKAIYIPFPQAIPNKYTIDMDHCIQCGLCKDVCEPHAINFDDKPKKIELDVGTIVVATGFDPYDPTDYKPYGFGRFENVITGLQMERELSSFGPTTGKPVRPSDNKAPHSIAFIQCVGSRNCQVGMHPYCSRVCCMYAMKQARQYKEKHPESDVTIFYMDIRAFGKGYEEFYEIAAREYGINFIRGRASEIYENPENKNIVIRAEDTLLKRPVELEFEMVVLSVGLEPRKDMQTISRMVGVAQTGDGFLMEAHPKLRPVDTLSDGVFIAGAVQGPKDIPDAVAQAKGAASAAASLMARGEVEIEPYFSKINEAMCSKCLSCIDLCPYGAISFDKYEDVVRINEVLCKGCGTCAAACPCGAISQNHFREKQIFAMLDTAIPVTANGKI
ncbi:MAG TPA: CoB--CoM heterodisulfide reductase iron-sulfur subunit A family protein [Candidatus Lokiarchaeia archaeon]|nr:CoB--CoM heterodisulfide reductase iron-sulfur subunit A family protein [Candidatus Lokiarchaeia archaeon]